MTIAERIAALPTAVNIAEPFSGRLTQGAYGSRMNGAGQAKPDITEASTLRVSLYAVDASGYDKASAVNKQWRKMNTFNLLDVLDGTADTSNRTLSVQELEKRLQEGSLLDEVSDTDFDMLKFEFSGLGFEDGTVSDKFRKNTEYLASRYAAMEDRIKDTCTGGERDEKLSRLKELYQNTLERMAREYVGTVGGLLNKYGVSGEEEKLYKVFKNGVNERVSEYRDFLKENPGFAGLEGTKDAWLLKDDEYIAAKLREKEITSAGGRKSAGYSLHDLDVLGQYVSSLSEAEAKANTYELNEERMGLELAVLAMKTDILGKKEGIGAALQATLNHTLRGYINVFLEQFERRLSENRKQAYIASDIQGNAGLDRGRVWDVYNRTMESYHVTKDMLQAMTEGAEYGKARYFERMNLGNTKDIYRYRNGIGYWNQTGILINEKA